MTSLSADEALIERYQFSHNPFSARVPGFRFFAARRKPLLTELHQRSQRMALVNIVCGPPGSGKTLMRQALVASSNKHNVLCLVATARQYATSHALLQHFSEGLGGHYADCDGLLGQIARLAQEGQTVYLLVDDAERLHDEALQDLVQLAIGDRDGRAHVFLFARETLLPRLDTLGESERCQVMHLSPYSFPETCAYLAQRIEGVGQSLEVIFDGEQLEQIHQASGGWPGEINRVAAEVLHETLLAEGPGGAQAGSTASGLPRRHVLAVLGILLLLGGLVLFGRQGDSLGLLARLSGEPVASEAAAPAAEAPAIVFADGQSVPLPLAGQAQPLMREPLAREVARTAGAELDAVHAAQPQSAGRAAGAAVVSAPAPAAASTAPPAPATPAAPPSPPPPAPAPAPAAVPAPRPAPAQTPPAAPARAAAPAPAPARAPAAAPAGSAADNSWYLSQPVGQYTLQLVGTRTEAAARQLAATGSEYRYFRKQHQGQPLYVVTYGRFANAAAARAAVSALPARLQAGKPWPRTFASIQQEIRQASR